MGYTPQLLTGLWMGYAEGGQTLEYDLEYSRELNDLPGGITPAMIWKAYMEQVLEGEPIEKFEGVEMPAEEDRTTQSDAEPSNPTDPTGAERLPGGASDAGRSSDSPSSASPASVSPSSAGPSTASPASVSPSTSSASPAPRNSSARPRR
jgi:membrane peptidoglycan carboxypeptidase